MLNAGVAPIETCNCFAKSINTAIEIFNEHNYNSLPENILNGQALINKWKRIAVDDMYIRPSTVLYSELKNYDIKILTSGDVLSIKINVHNARCQKLPKLPTTLTRLITSHETLINMEFKTIEVNNFLLVNNNETNILGFSTVRNLQALCGLNMPLVDGTFKSSLKLLYQLFNSHGMLNNNYIPFVYFLPPSKLTNCYTDECRKKMTFNSTQFECMSILKRLFILL